MTRFFGRTRPFHLIPGLTLITILLAGCGSSGTSNVITTPTATKAAAPVNGKGCTKVGVLLPELAQVVSASSQVSPVELARLIPFLQPLCKPRQEDGSRGKLHCSVNVCVVVTGWKI